ncbi:MAG: hypothetical protein WBY53_02870 [Acidobacteriaceae bacterium]
MPDPIPFPKQPTAPVPPASEAQPSNASKPPSGTRFTGWRLVLGIIAISAVALRLLLFLLVHVSSHHTALPTWPLHSGDVLTLTPGDANIAKWAQNPLATGFVVQQLESDGRALTGIKICALEPDYMADAQQPGGTLTLLDQQPTGDWRVHWSGGDTLPPFVKQKGDFDANCGTNAIVSMTSAQLHSFLNILAGIADSAPPAAPQPHSK